MASANKALARRARLTAKAQFDAVLASPLRWHTEYFRFHLRPDPACKPARLGMTVPKRIVPNATERNRIRRQIREGFRTREPCIHGFDLVLVAKSQALNCPALALRSDLQKGFSRLARSLTNPSNPTPQR